MNNQWLDVEQLSDYIHCSKSKIYKLTMAGEIPFYKFGRKLLFKQSQIDNFMEMHKIENEPQKGIVIEK